MFKTLCFLIITTCNWNLCVIISVSISLTVVIVHYVGQSIQEWIK